MVPDPGRFSGGPGPTGRTPTEPGGRAASRTCVQHDDVDSSRRSSAAWRLSRADTAPLVLSFLGTSFVEDNVRAIPESELVARLDDHSWAVDGRAARASGTEPRYPRAPQAYVDHWTHPDQSWSRAWYPPGSAEPHYDATPAVEQAVRWVASSRGRGFVGTESRLNTVFESSRQLAVGTQTDPAERSRELEERRAAIDDEIAQVRAGRVAVLDAAAQRDRYQQLTQTAADSLSDFREVEANFRSLDRESRERITGWDGAKGESLEEVVRSRTAIAESDQGRSFHAFYDFLLDRRRQEEFAALVERVQSLDAIAPDVVRPAPGTPGPAVDAAAQAAAREQEHRRSRRVHYDWLDAGERTQATVRTLSEQLRRFLDDQVWLENRRVMDISRGVEAKALAARDVARAAGRAGAPPGMPVDAVAPEVVSPTERPLFTPRPTARLDSDHVEVGDDDFEVDALYDQVHVDPERLARTVRATLSRPGGPGEVALADSLADAPLEHGSAELVTYSSLEDPRFVVVHDDERSDEVRWEGEAPAGPVAEDGAPDPVVRVARSPRPGGDPVSTTRTARDPESSVVVTSSLKGVVYRESGEASWRDSLAREAQVRDAVAMLGSQVVVDEGDGYAYSRSQPEHERDERVPRSIPRRESPFDVSSSLASSRKRLAQADSEGGETRLVLTRSEIVDSSRVFLTQDAGAAANEARLVDRVDALVRRVVELGFSRPAGRPDPDGPDAGAPGDPGDPADAEARRYEVRRILKAFVDAQWLADFDARLAQYSELAADGGGPGAGTRTGAAGAGTGDGGVMEGSFSAVESHDPAADLDARAGFRLERLEVLNWGTFDQRVWAFDLDGRNASSTGDIGSGKSTIVDAVTTSLVPSHRISYNKAAGAGARERSSRSYVAGHYKSERDEATGTTRHVGSRERGTYSVVSGRFSNRGFDQEVTLAQVFWLAPGQAGQPDRFFVTADRPSTITEDFAGFGGDVTASRRRSRESGAQVRDHFPDYGRDFRRSLGIPSEQAMDSFHQTVSMKSVGDLGEFVREHMLEPFDADRWTDRLVAHFDDSTSAHDAVVRATAQIERLAPSLADCDAHDALGERAEALVARRDASRAFTASRRVADLDGLTAALDERVADGEARRRRVVDELGSLGAERQRLESERAGHGGDRLAAIESEVARREVERAARERR
ncbi:hypothetical protein OY671_006679, partial [Metschnikowia pulcherrima]